MYLSIDVGIKNLAFCLFCVDKQNENENEDKLEIIKWNVINLSNSNSIACCIHQTNKKNKESTPCKSPVKYFKSTHYFCLKHAKKQTDYKLPMNISAIKKLKSKELNELASEHSLIKDEDSGAKGNTLTKATLVSLFEQYIEVNCLENVEEINASKLDLVTIGKNMMTNFDDILKDHLLLIDTVIIENQISPIANRMKTLQGMISQYFIIRNDNIKIEFISSANKLKGATITADKVKLTYSDRKKLGIKYCLELIEKDKDKDKEDWSNYFSTHKKKDDLADSFLQGYWYINKNKNKK